MSRRRSRQVLKQIKVTYLNNNETETFDFIGLSSTEKSIKVHHPETKIVSYLAVSKITYKEL